MSRQQRGVFLLEALMGILIFSLGILTLVAMQTAAVSAQSDAQYRIQASNLADEILSEIWLGVDRSNPNPLNNVPPNLQASLAQFQHNPGGGPPSATTCNFSGAASTAPAVVAWANKINGGGLDGLPGATASMQQIVVNNVNASYNQVIVTLCWKTPVDANFHYHTLVSFIN
jgi:type IV pilus assembly protein PilV